MMALTREPFRVTIKMINGPCQIDHTNQTITLSVITLTGFHCFTYYSVFKSSTKLWNRFFLRKLAFLLEQGQLEIQLLFEPEIEIDSIIYLSDSDLRIINWRRAIIKNLERKTSFWFKVKQLGAVKGVQKSKRLVS